MTKNQIIDAIREAAKRKNKSSVSIKELEEIMGIRKEDWYGKYWAKWSDAIQEAGLEPNEFSSPAYDIEWMIEEVAKLTRELNHFPTKPELKIKNFNDKQFPTDTTLTKRLGRKSEIAMKVAEFCKDKTEYLDVYHIALEESKRKQVSFDYVELSKNEDELGNVYLIKSGKYYKIGRTNHSGRRSYELNIQLPEKAELIHVIQTDDPNGIETYWHQRFSSKRKNGEWFELNQKEIKAFKRRKFM